MDGSEPTPLLRRMSSLCIVTPPVCIYAFSTNLVLEIAGTITANSPVQMAQQRKTDNANQLWIWEENGLIASASNHNLVIEQGSQVIVARRKDDVHNWHQQWEFHRGFIRNMSNHNLVLDVEFNNSQIGASVCVFRPHKSGKQEHQQWGLRIGDHPYSLPVRLAPPNNTNKFDSSKVELRLKKMWNLNATFGKQSTPEEVFFNQVVSNRYCLINGLQLIRDELQLAFGKGGNLMACAADLSLPSVITTLAYTNCGDRINHSFHRTYDAVVGSRFASVDARGALKTEHFSPAGGGTDDGGVLAHVTVAHQLDETLRKKLYEGNRSSYVLVNIDLMTHVGCKASSESLHFGVGSESEFREPRGACGAIIASLTRYNQNNVVHDRIKRNLGEDNFKILQKKIILPDGTDITFVVAAAIVAVRGVHDTCQALANELDIRGIAHVTANTTVNTTTSEDHLFFLSRATVFSGFIKIQGFGVDASKYSGLVEEVYGRKRLVLLYDGKQGDQMDIETIEYTLKDMPDI